MYANNTKILSVEDDLDSSEMLRSFLEISGIGPALVTVHTAEDAQDAILRDGGFKLYILDYWLKGIDGMDLCRWIRKRDPINPIIFFSAVAGEPHRLKAIEAGAIDYFVKPDDLERLPQIIEALLAGNPVTASAVSRSN